jgi:hypothetical protein
MSALCKTKNALGAAIFDSKYFSPPRKPFRNRPVGLQRRKCYAAKTAFAVDNNALVVAEIAELVRLDFVFLGFVVIHVAFSGTVAP